MNFVFLLDLGQHVVMKRNSVDFTLGDADVDAEILQLLHVHVQ